MDNSVVENENENDTQQSNENETPQGNENETPQGNEVRSKMHYSGTVLKTSLAGALIDIGSETPAVIHISQLVGSNPDEPIKGVEDVLKPGEKVEVWVRKIKDGRVELTMIKPLDIEWRDLKKGMVVKGQVVRLEKFGAFVEIGAERPGLIHISEMAHGYVRQPSDVVNEGDEVEAQVLDFNRKKKQIKLSLKALQPEPVKEEPVFRAPADTPRKEKPARRRKPRREGEMGEESQELLANLESSTKAEAEPTAMEIAMREAMERAKERKAAQDAKRKSKTVSAEQDDILSRTLESKPHAS
jgi:small subunit ribosomal protein S1